MPDPRKPTSLGSRTQATIAFQARLLNAVEHAIIAVDLDGTILYWNHVAERTYGWPASEMLGHRKVGVLMPEGPPDRIAEIMARLHAGLSWSGELLLKRQDGTTLPVIVTDSPVTNRSGRLIGIVGVSVDISERKRDEEALRASEERFRGIVGTAHDGIWTIDAHGVTTFVNHPLAELLGYRVDEMLGQPLASFLDDARRELFVNSVERLQRLRSGADDVRLISKNGTVVWAQVAASALLDHAGSQAGTLINVTDVTERRTIEAERARLAAIVQFSDDAIFSKTLDGIITSWNRGAEQLYGYAAEEILGQSATCLAPSERPDEITQLLARITRGERVEHFETERVRKDGQHVDVSVSMSPIRDSSGRVSGAATIAREITAQLRSQRALQEREAQLAESQVLAHIGSWELDLATHRLKWSDEHYRIFGLKPGTLLADVDIASLFHPDDRLVAHQAFEASVAERNGYSLELRVIRPDGEVRWIHNRSSFVANGRAGRIVGTAQDITDRIENDRKQMQLSAHIKSLLSSTSEGIYSLDRDGRCTFINAAGAALLGYSPDELVGQPMDAVLHSPHLQGSASAVENCYLEGKSSPDVDPPQFEVYCHRDGTLLPVEIAANPLVEERQVVGMVVAFRDISDRQRAESNLRQSEQRLSMALEIAGLGTFDWDLLHNRIVLSETLERMVGLEPGTFGGNLANFEAAIHVEDLPAVRAAMADSIAHNVPFRTEFRVRRVDGLVCWMAASGQVYRDAEGHPTRMLGVNRDVTEQKQAEHQREAMAQSERMRALGQMASGIAHDLNQSLMLVASYSDLARQALTADPPDLEELDDLLTTSTQAALDGGESVKRLLQFTRSTPKRVDEAIDVDHLVREAAALTAPRWRDGAQAEGRRIALNIQVDGHPTIQGSHAQLREVMTNLIFNAVDALPEGGSINLRAGISDGRAIIEVADTGTGMSAEIQARAFEPFFTTKGTGGTGLGLAMVFGIVDQHRGDIEVQSAKGVGTTFRMRFPVVETTASLEWPALVPALFEPFRPLHVLVVDDEPMMTQAVVRMLRPSGHTVTTARSGEDALTQLGKHVFDVVVSDLGMGAGMNGWELADVVRKRWPTVRFMLATGWGAAIGADEAHSKGVESILCKPYQVADLLQALATPVVTAARTEEAAGTHQASTGGARFE